ncbi:MAG: tRNA threonylcarbamoyladenosine dehydratase [Desulfobulbaceae bacterium]|uniref:tRNA threonylcarbamoyladenosine dehydratase n=1 Tax=Candidatus Desulfobia pelagia TaxID=2841692 RepID=A0A8J6NF25_9BACT|nr:tRNA threonylcarbamoyladenosine dehydratase [Candidatus Desulfobia pelagia]
MADDRFARLKRLIGPERLDVLRSRTVTIVGLGAVGGYALEGLARSGVNHFRLVDFDQVSLTNINRQVLALESTVGRPKVEVARDRVRDINPDCQVEILNLFVDAETVGQVLDPQPDLIIDAIDSLNSKIELLVRITEQGIPVISSMGAALRTDPTLIRVDDIMDTWKCPMAKRIRKRLRRRGVEGGIPCVYSTEDIDFAYSGVEIVDEPEQGHDQGIERGRVRQILGSLPTVTAIFGLTIANLAILQLSSLEKEK